MITRLVHPQYSVLHRRRFLLASAGWALAGRSLAAAGPSGPAVINPLQQPADKTARAPDAVLNRLARAGKRLVAVGERGIAVWSDDGGQQWQQAQVPVSVTLTSVVFVDDRLGWAAGHAGVLLHTNDGGQTWSLQLDGIALAKAALEQAQQQQPAKDDAQRATRLKQAQQLVSDGPDKPFLALRFVDARRGLAVGAYGIAAATDDGGKTWQPCSERFDNPKGLHLYGLAQSGSSWLVAGEQGFIARSVDDALSFARVGAPFKGSFFTLITTRDGAMLAAGLLGNVCRIDPVQGTVTPSELPAKVTVLSSTQLSNGPIVLVESSGRLLVSNDGGRRFGWHALPSRGPISSLVETGEGGTVAAGPGGVRRLPVDIKTLLQDVK